jgi:hypothetical protein
VGHLVRQLRELILAHALEPTELLLKVLVVVYVHKGISLRMDKMILTQLVIVSLLFKNLAQMARA